ncbi:precorrin-3B synthase [Mycolicibacterium duvalii]|uniref:precorrin-3B synthase n=1 Tax=Mycolicibacterium duvalii TaxID=39688 RepID=UPI000BEEA1FA|nr:precorrin-3B synthase [Mycolicibacterium duvalii]MCV7369494.1 precorrin-3B synthase [Mycolicibacterium duvalii]PEG42134.1 precorrin-3B synthase [Mycolicibacterium duvalii]
MPRSRDDDACPGALQTHTAADGELARIRLPGGMLRAEQLEAIALAAIEHGSSTLELTSRGNLQIRGVGDTAAVADRLAAAGLLPSPTHERVRNIVASPLSGRVGGTVDIRGAVTALDRAIREDSRLAELPGRFMFGIDDGRGDVSGLAADIGSHAVDGTTAAVLLAGRDTGVRVAHGDVIAMLTTLAHRFLDVREKAWRVTELDDPGTLLGQQPTAAPGRTWPGRTRPPVGWIAQEDGRVALGAAVPLGVLDAEVARFLAAVDAPIVVTPWRSVLLFDLDESVADTALRVLAPMGLVFDENSPWLDVSACTGLPGCARSRADVRADAAAAVRAAAVTGTTHRHFVGCERACGSPAGGQVVVATGDGYRPLSAHP